MTPEQKVWARENEKILKDILFRYDVENGTYPEPQLNGLDMYCHIFELHDDKFDEDWDNKRLKEER